MHIVVGRTHIRRVGIGQPPLLRCLEYGIGGHLIEAACLQGRYTLREDKRLAGEVLRHILHPLMVVVEADKIDGAALEEVVVRRRLIAAGRDGARGVVTLHDLCQMPGEQTLHGEFPVLRQRRGVVACVQDQVSLFQRQRVSFGRRPLLEHLVADRPHQDARVVTVAQNQIREVALVPLVEEPRIVVLRLLAAPHVEALVHHDQSHRVAHVQQLWCRGIMRRTDGVHTHRLQLRQLTVQGILVECSTQTAEVVMLTHAVQLEVLAVQPEARLGIKLKVAEATSGLVGVHHLAPNGHLRQYLIHIRLLTRPEHRLGYGDCRLCPFRLSDDLSVRIDERILD